MLKTKIKTIVRLAVVLALTSLLAACDIPFIDIDIPLIPGI